MALFHENGILKYLPCHVLCAQHQVFYSILHTVLCTILHVLNLLYSVEHTLAVLLFPPAPSLVWCVVVDEKTLTLSVRCPPPDYSVAQRYPVSGRGWGSGRGSGWVDRGGAVGGVVGGVDRDGAVGGVDKRGATLPSST